MSINDSNFSRRLVPIGRILEMKGWYVWGCSPVEDADGKIHVLFSRWPESTGIPGNPMFGWMTHSEVVHAVAERPEGPYTVTGTVLKGRGGDAWDALSIHNPTIHRVDDRYAMFYMGNSRPENDSNQKNFLETKRIGLALANQPAGPWTRVGDKPLIDVNHDPDTWDNAMVSNPAFCQAPDGRYMLFYKGMEINSWREEKEVAGNRKYGLAIADNLEGPYLKYINNPVLEYPNVQGGIEDAYVFHQKNKFVMVSRDMGLFSKHGGLLHKSIDGIQWPKAEVAFHRPSTYFKELGNAQDRAGQLERPQILMRNGRPAFLFCALSGGKYGTSSPVVFEIKEDK